MDLQTVARAKQYMENLANGINPLDGTAIPDGEVVNHVRLSRCFFYVADVLGQVLENGGVGARPRPVRQQFALPMEKRAEFAFSEEPISVSEIVRRINLLSEDPDMIKLTHTAVTDWLLSIGLLYDEVDAEGKHAKRPTPRGIAMGISLESRTGMNGPYSVVVYNLAAQQFLLDNLDGVIEMKNAVQENQGKPWTAEEDTTLRRLWQSQTEIKQIAASLKRNSGAVRARLKKLGLL